MQKLTRKECETRVEDRYTEELIIVLHRIAGANFAVTKQLNLGHLHSGVVGAIGDLRNAANLLEAARADFSKALYEIEQEYSK